MDNIILFLFVAGQIEELETWNSIYRGKHQGNTRETPGKQQQIF
jgi:hypothetical protein